MRRKSIRIFFMFTCLALLLAACGKSSVTQGDSTDKPVGSEHTATTEKTTVPGDGKQVTLRFSWWGSDVRHEATLAAIAKYEELNPNVRIEGEFQGYDGYQQKLMTQLAGGTEPDLMQLDYIWYTDMTSHSDVFLDLSKAPNVDLSAYEESILKDYCHLNGTLIALPMGSNGSGAMINTEFFSKYDIPVDTVWTWNHIIEEGRRINEINPDDYLLALESTSLNGFVFGPYIYSKTGVYWVYDEDYKITASRETIVEAMTLIYDLFDSGAAQPLGEASLFTSQTEQNPKWLNAEMGMTFDWSSTVDKYKSTVGKDSFAVTTPPFADDGNNQEITFKPSMVLAVSNRSDHAEIAADFANWMMTDPEAAQLLGIQRSVPTSQVAFKVLQELSLIDPDVAAMVEATNKNPAPPVPIVQANAELTDIMKHIFERVVYGELTPEAAADVFLTEVQAQLDILKSAK